MKLKPFIFGIIIALNSCSPINKTDRLAAEKVIEVIGCQAELLKTDVKESSVTKYSNYVDFRINNCYWINELKYDKDMVASYAAFHLFKGLSGKTKTDFEAIKISIDNDLLDDVNGKYFFSMEQLNLVKNGFSNIETYLENLISDDDFKPMDFVESESLNINKVDSINSEILRQIEQVAISIDLFAFGLMEDGYIVVLAMIEKKPDDFKVVRFVFNESDYEKITYFEL